MNSLEGLYGIRPLEFREGGLSLRSRNHEECKVALLTQPAQCLADPVLMYQKLEALNATIHALLPPSPMVQEPVHTLATVSRMPRPV